MQTLPLHAAARFAVLATLLCFSVTLTSCGDDDDDMAASCPDSFVAFTVDGGDEQCVDAILFVANGGGADAYSINASSGSTSIALTGIVDPEPGTLSLGGDFSFDPPFADASASITVGDNTYRPVSTNFGSLTFTSVDTDSDQLAGTFEFMAVNSSDSTDVVSVTNGRFDIQ